MSKPTQEEVKQTQQALDILFEEFPPELKAALASELPTEPGAYVDQDGKDWTLSDSGNWYDHYEFTFDPKYNFALPLLGVSLTRKEES